MNKANPLAAFEHEVEQVSGVITSARHLLAENKTVDLSELEDKVRKLCQTALAAPAEDQPRVRSAVEAVRQNLNHLSGELAEQLEVIDERMRVSDRRQAVSAYARSES